MGKNNNENYNNTYHPDDSAYDILVAEEQAEREQEEIEERDEDKDEDDNEEQQHLDSLRRDL